MTDARHANQEDTAGFVHRIRVRYGDCDMQRVVFNANYLAYVDDTIVMWLLARLGDDVLQTFDYLVKKVTLEWFSSATVREVVAATPTVTRWGNSSFDVSIRMAVDDRLVAVADLVLVGITPGTLTPAPVPEHVRQALDTAAIARQ